MIITRTSDYWSTGASDSAVSSARNSSYRKETYPRLAFLKNVADTYQFDKATSHDSSINLLLEPTDSLTTRNASGSAMSGGVLPQTGVNTYRENNDFFNSFRENSQRSSMTFDNTYGVNQSSSLSKSAVRSSSIGFSSSSPSQQGIRQYRIYQ